MADRDVAGQILARAIRAGLKTSPALASALASYLDLLARWNRKINLTALAVDPPEDDAIDRLIIEPLLAARLLEARDRLIVDVGSGGGSPAVPMHMAAPDVRFVLVEVKARKAAFLREAVRVLGLAHVEVEHRAFLELLAKTDFHETVDVVTLRAVRMEGDLLRAIGALVRPGGRLFWFASGRTARPSATERLAAGFSSEEARAFPLVVVGGSDGELRVLTKIKLSS